MKRFTAVLFSVLLCALISMSMIRPVQAAIWPTFPLPELTWLPPYLDKADGRVVYRHGSTANLLVPVKNEDYSQGLNVSRVIISFDWGQNKTLDLSANIKQVGYYEIEFFTVSFTADATEAISSELEHEYTIYVEHVNATTGPTQNVGTYEAEWWEFTGTDYRFVVFSTDQADALDVRKKYEDYEDLYDDYYWLSPNASHLAARALIEGPMGNTYYDERGEYALAKIQYESALNLFSQAVTAELEWRTKVSEADLQVYLTEAEANMAMANAMLRQADATVNQSYAFILFGIGFIFIGIATIIYASKKPKAA